MMWGEESVARADVVLAAIGALLFLGVALASFTRLSFRLSLGVCAGLCLVVLYTAFFTHPPGNS